MATMADLDALALGLPEVTVDVKELRDLVVEAWLRKVQKRVANAWLAQADAAGV